MADHLGQEPTCGRSAYARGVEVAEGFHRLPGFRPLIVVLAVISALLPLPVVSAGGEGTEFYLVHLLLSLWAVLRVSGCGIKDTGHHLVVRNPVRTVRIPWADVQDIELGRFGVMPKVGVRRTDGTAVGVFGLPIAASGDDADASTLRLVERLRSKARQVHGERAG